MARFYGTLHGARGPTSRLGHASSGLTATAQSCSGDIVVELFVDTQTDEDCVSIIARDHNSYSASSLYLYSGPIKHLTEVEGHDFLVLQMAQRALQEKCEAVEKEQDHA